MHALRFVSRVGTLNAAAQVYECFANRCRVMLKGCIIVAVGNIAKYLINFFIIILCTDIDSIHFAQVYECFANRCRVMLKGCIIVAVGNITKFLINFFIIILCTDIDSIHFAKFRPNTFSRTFS